MRPPQPPLARDERSQEVSELQSFLHVMAGMGDLNIGKDPGDGTLRPGTDWRQQFATERRQQLFGPATELRLKQFQAQQLGAKPTGQFDGPSAQYAEKWLSASGLRDGSDGWVVLGEVSLADGGATLANMEVSVADEDLRRPQQLGAVFTNKHGFFVLRYKAEQFEPADGRVARVPDLMLSVRAPGGPALATARPARWPARAVEIVDIAVPRLEPEPTEFERLEYHVPPLLAGQGAPRAEGLRPPEFDDLPPYEIEARDLPHLERKTGLASDWIEAWANAARLQRETVARLGDGQSARLAVVESLARAFFYAWCREGRPLHLAAVLGTTWDEWVGLRKRAVDVARVQPRDWVPLYKVFAWLQRLAIADGVQGAGVPGNRLSRALAWTRQRPPNAVLVDFVNWLEKRDPAALEEPVSFDEFIGGLDGDDKRSMQGLVRTLQVSGLCGDREDLTRALEKALDGTDVAESIDPLADWGTPDWEALVAGVAGGAGDPGRLAGVGSVAKAARVLQARAEVLAPARAMAARLRAGTLEAPALEGFAAGEWVTLLKEQPAGVDRLVQGAGVDHPDAQRIENPACRRYLQELGGFVRLGLGLECGGRLMGAGVGSVGTLGSYGGDVVRQQLLKDEPADLVEEIADRLDAMVEASSAVLESLVVTGGAALHKARHDQGGQLSWSQHAPAHTAEEAGAGVERVPMTSPTLPGMFGDLSECACLPAESVFGVPSYLVDLLELLKQVPGAPATAGVATARDEFFARQPHVQHLELGRENAEIELPHIDLALEVLEWHAARPRLWVAAPKSGTAVSWFGSPPAPELVSLLGKSCRLTSEPLQCTDLGADQWRAVQGLRRWTVRHEDAGTANASLRITEMSIRRTQADPEGFAEPAHRVPEAYATLAQARFPLDLPFDRDQAEAEAFEERLRPSAHEVLEALPASAGVPAAVVLQRRVGLAAATAAVLASPPLAGSSLWAHWGFDGASTQVMHDPDSGERLSAEPLVLLQRASVLRARTGLELPRLEEALATGYLGPLVLVPRDACKASEMRVCRRDGSPPGEGEFDRLQRFVRWWRQVPEWPAAVLGTALQGANGDELQAVADVRHLMDVLGVAPEVALGLIQPMSAVVLRPASADHPAQTLFDRVFLSSRVDATSRSELESLIRPVTGQPAFKIEGRLRGALRTATGLSDAELSALPGQLQWSADLTTATVTRLWRLGVLARALREPADALVRLSLAVHFPWDQDLGVGDLVGLARLVRTVQSSGVPRDKAVRVLRLQADAAPQREVCAQALREASAPAHAWPSEEPALRQLGVEQLSKVIEPALAEEMLSALLEGTGATLSPELVRALVKSPAGEKQEPIFRDENDLRTLLTRIQQPRARVEALLDRLHERRTGWHAEVAKTLASLLQPLQLAAVDEALRFDESAPNAPGVRREAIAALSGPLLEGEVRGDVAALMPEAAAAALLVSLKPGETAGSRVRRMQERVGSALRQRTLLRLMRTWTSWDEAQARAFLGERMPLNAAGSTAGDLMLSPAFWQTPSTLSAQQSSELSGWWVRMGLLRQLEGELGSLPAMPGWNWLELLDGTKPAPGEDWQAIADRRSEVFALLALSDAGRLGLPTLQSLGAGFDAGVLADRLQLTADDVRALAFSRRPMELLALCDRAAVLRRFALSAADVVVLAGGDSRARAEVARAALGRRVAPAAWKETLRAVHDGLRKRQRDALVGFLLNQGAMASPGLHRVDDLYEHYLIDPQIQPCFGTTRILQAVAAVQLFVQRVLGGREPGVPATDKLRQRWTWMRSYRLWEANRRVFAYPENLLLPELLDRKSEALIKLEGRIRQNELDEDEAREAFAEYLGDVAAAGQTVVVGMHDDTSGDKRRLFVLGRTPHAPYRYFWRLGEDFGELTAQWTPWRRIELDIKGEQVAPLVLGGELHLVWVEFANEGDPASRRCQATVRWSRFNGRTWGQPDESTERLTLPIPVGRSERSGFAIRVRPKDGNSVDVWVFSAQSDANFRTDAPPDEPGPVANLSVEVNHTTQRTVFARAWMRLKTLEGHEILVNKPEVDKGLVFRFKDTTSGYEGVTGNPLDWQMKDDIPPHEITASLTLAGTPFSATEGKHVPRLSFAHRQSQVIHLNFEFDLTKAGKTAAELGFAEVDLPSKWIQRATFELQAGGLGRWSAQGQGNVLSGPPGTQPTQASYLELEDQPHGVALMTPGSVAATTVFEPLAATRFTAVAANGEPDVAVWMTSRNAPAAWHITDGPARRYVDLAAGEEIHWGSPLGARPSTHRALPDSYVEAQTFRSGWLGRRDWLALQAVTFGVELPPNPAPSVFGSSWPTTPEQKAKLAFDERMPYSVYNWEAFFHAPLLVADQLTKQHKFELAEQWLRLVFDPTRPTPEEFLRCRALQQVNPAETALHQLRVLARAQAGLAESDADAVRALIERWRDNPYRPFAIARARPVAFLWRPVIACAENYIAWGDALYRRNTREAVAEAAQLYAQASQLLGPRPRVKAAAPARERHTYAEIAAQGPEGLWDAFGNAWLPKAPALAYGSGRESRTYESNHRPTSTVGTLYFCVPANDRLLRYWDMVEDRLYNIRHCRNIDGLTQVLPLLDPPIDPELLARAVAAGLDIDEVVSGLHGAPPTHRYTLLAARAAELANEAKALGNALLAALEKRDAETLQALRSTHEVEALRRLNDLRQLGIDEANKQLETLRTNREAAASRLTHYRRLMGEGTSAIPGEGEVGGEMPMLGGPNGLTVKDQSLGLIIEETEQKVGLKEANGWSSASAVARASAGVLHFASAFASFTDKEKLAKGLTALAQAGSATADVFASVSAGWRYYADEQGARAGHLRRREDWAFQSNQALRELRQIDRQIAAAGIRLGIAQKELANQQAQLAEAEVTQRFLADKFTRAELYDWMTGELKASCRAAFNMALQLARRAEAAARREHAATDLAIIRTDYWSGYRAGLLAGEKLSQDLKRLEVAVLDLHRREHEMTKHVSLRRLQPQALVDLLATGNCVFELPDWLFDLDMPGHYLRRLKTVSLSIPCVVGPYGSVNCRLTLLRSVVRTSSALHAGGAPGGDRYIQAGDADARFSVSYHGTESIVTSSGRDDSGMFETNLRDERYLPFEHAGAVSRWRLDLPSLGAQFDATTLTDVILHLRYTARDGGQSLGEAAAQALTETWQRDPVDEGLAALLSMRADFAADWARARKATNEDLIVDVTDAAALPYWMLATGRLTLAAEGARAFAIRSDVNAQVGAQRAAELRPSELSVKPLQTAGALRVALKQNDWRDADDVLLVFAVGSKQGAP